MSWPSRRAQIFFFFSSKLHFGGAFFIYILLQAQLLYAGLAAPVLSRASGNHFFLSGIRECRSRSLAPPTTSRFSASAATAAFLLQGNSRSPDTPPDSRTLQNQNDPN